MPCEQYKNELVEAAAGSTTPSGELLAHLGECASCSAAFAQEQSLFAAVDSGLHAAANTEAPPSLLPRVRVALDEATAPRLRWVQPLVLASAGIALVFVVFLLARPHRSVQEEVAKQAPAIVPIPKVSAAKTNLETTNSSGSTQVAANHFSHFHAARNSTNLYAAASSNPEVLVPPDEREAFARLVAVLNRHSDVAAALMAKAPQKGVLVTADPLQIPDIEIKPLEGAETETSKGASEKQ